MTQQQTTRELKTYLINSANATNKLHGVATEMNALVLSLLAEIQMKEEELMKVYNETLELSGKHHSYENKIKLLEEKIVGMQAERVAVDEIVSNLEEKIISLEKENKELSKSLSAKIVELRKNKQAKN